MARTISAELVIGPRDASGKVLAALEERFKTLLPLKRPEGSPAADAPTGIAAPSEKN